MEGKPKEAAVHFVRSLTLLPQLCDDFESIASLLADVNPALREACKQASETWPAPLSFPNLSSLAGIAADVLLRHVLRSTPVRGLALERLLTSIRLALLQAATRPAGEDRIDADLLSFCGALAQQCFINEYVFASTAEEARQAGRLKDDLAKAMGAGASVAPLTVLTVATYFPLHSLPGTETLLERHWPAPVSDVLAQQVQEPRQDRACRDAIPRLKAESPVPLYSHGSISMNRALLAAGLVDRLEVMVFPMITGASGTNPILADLPDIDLELVDSRLFDGRVQQLVYIPTVL